MVRPGTREPDADAAFELVWRTIQKGVLMFAPVGYGDATVKICPPLSITAAALAESLDAFEEAAAEVLRRHRLSQALRRPKPDGSPPLSRRPLRRVPPGHRVPAREMVLPPIEFSELVRRLGRIFVHRLPLRGSGAFHHRS